jgi:hypothetical protein
VYILEWNGEGTGVVNIVAQWSSEGGESIDGASYLVGLEELMWTNETKIL